MKSKLLITQGSQAIQLIREMFSCNIRPDNILVLTIDDTKNKSFLTFLDYYNIQYNFVNAQTINNAILDYLKYAQIDLIISFSNPFKINKKVLSQNINTINFHPGILPNYKGSLSTVYSLLNEEKEVGGTWHFVTESIDSGNIISSVTIKIKPIDTAFSLNHKIFSAGITKLDEVLNLIDSNFKGIEQNRQGKFYHNKFPNIDNLDKHTQTKIKYFPPEFI